MMVRTIGATIAAWVAFGGQAAAQVDRTAAAAIAPVEVRQCHYVDGKGPADLDGLARSFNQWLDQNKAPPYSAYVLEPIAHSAQTDFDLTWVGAWPDGTTMGESMAQLFAAGAALKPLFDGVMRCADDVNYSTVTMRQPAAPGRFGPLEIATCTLRLGASLDDALNAVSDWLKYSSSYGSTAANWLLFPAYGERSDAKYNFKWAIGYESYEAFGREYDQSTNGDGLDKYNALFEFVMRCDSPRLYAVRHIRNAP